MHFRFFRPPALPLSKSAVYEPDKIVVALYIADVLLLAKLHG
jgi:hypothetical protein